MSKQTLPYNHNLKLLSSKLRKEATPEERHLWYDFLSTYSVQFNRQRIIGNYIVDFYCSKAKLIVELDGSQHYSDRTIEYDCKRTAYFNSLGLEVIRFTNLDIKENFYGVCTYIDNKVKEKIGI